MKNVIIGKRQILMASLVTILGLAVFVNWYYTGKKGKNGLQTQTVDASVSETQPQRRPEIQTREQPETQQQPQNQTAAAAGSAAVEVDEMPAGSTYFSAVRMNRSAVHDEAAESLQKVIDSCDADSEAAVAAVNRLTVLEDTRMCEADLESLITARTGGDCVAVIGENGVEIVVDHNVLNDETVLVITDIVSQKCNKPEEIKITGA